MKKIGFICFALALIACGCSKEQSNGLLDIAPEGNVVSFKATFEGETPDTKLGINTGSGALTWMDGDAIAVQMTDDTFVPFTYSSSTEKFSASLGEKKVKDGGVAYYPATIAIDGTPGSVNLPNSYDVSVSGSIAKVCPPMIATVNLGDENLALKHLGGILSIRVSYVPADADRLVLMAVGSGITGTFTVTDAAEDYISAKGGVGTVTLNFTEGDFGTTPAEFFIPVPVTSFSNGFTVNFKNASNDSLYANTASNKGISVSRANIARMDQLTVPVSIYVRDNGTNWTSLMAYYSSNTYSSDWGVNEISDFTKTYTHNGNSYYRFTLPATETPSTKCLLIFHDSENDGVGRVQLPDLDLGGDRYYTISGDGSDRMYVKCYKGGWGSLNLYLYDNGYPMGAWPGSSSTNTFRLDLEHHNADFVYWDFPSSIKDDSYEYGVIINDGTSQTAGNWANKIAVTSGVDIVAYITGDTGAYGLYGIGKVATYTED